MKKLLQSLFILLFVAGSAMAQDRTITGTVTDKADGSPLPGVTVRVTGTQTGTQTSASGKYALSIPSSAKSLQVSYIGYADQTVPIGSSNVIDFSLSTDATELGEVIVIAYGTIKKENFTGAASIVASKNFENRPTTSFQKALQGAASGVQVTSVSGQPGAATQIRVRGIGSISAGASPLYVVDGVATTSGDLTQVAQTADILSTLNQNDIESVTVLKDAAATAIYGSRGANGVVLITTKQGRSGATKFTANYATGASSQAVDKHEVLNAQEYFKLYFDAYYAQRLAAGLAPDAAATAANALVISRLTQAGASGTRVNNPFNTLTPFIAGGGLSSGARLLYDTDWRDEVLRRGITHDANVSASGGGEKFKFYTSGGYFNQKGIVIGSDFQRLTGKFNMSNDVNEFLSFGVNTTLARTDQNTPAGAGGGANPVRFADIASNIYSLYVRDASGNPVLDEKGKPVYSYVNPVSPDFNPVGLNELDEYNTKAVRVSTLPYVQAKFLNGFTAKAQFGLEYNTLRERQFYNAQHGNGVSVNGRGYRYSREDITTTFVNTLTYDKQIGDHTINVLVGQESFQNKLDDIYTQATNFAFPGAEELISASTPNTAQSKFTEARFASYFSRLNYNYNSRYYLSGSFRRDGDSRFGTGNKYGNFYSVGGAWRISQENFFKNISFVNELKLRASYGVLGNNDIGRYAAQGLYTLGRNYEGASGIAYTQLANDGLQWERAKTSEVGLEFSILNRRINGEAAYFKRGSDELLFNRPLSRLTGFNTIVSNFASMDNTGFEFMLSGTPIQTSSFNWNVSVNVTALKNKIKKLTQQEVVDPDDAQKRLEIGGDRYAWYLREYAGIDQTDGRAMWYKDEAVNGVATGNRVTTKVYSEAIQYDNLGSALPDFSGGFNNTLSYKDFDLSVYTYFSVGGKIYDNLYQALMHNGISAGQQMSRDVLNAWSPTNTTSNVPRFLPAANTDLSNSASSRFLFSGTYMRVKNISLGYTLNKSIASKAKLSNLRVFLMAENPFTFAAHKGMDPEATLAGSSNNDIPNIKTFSAGLTVGF